MTVAWRVTPGQQLLHRVWDGQCVLYNDASGATHLLQAATLDLLCALRDGELTPDELADPDLDTVLQQLQGLYLVEAC